VPLEAVLQGKAFVQELAFQRIKLGVVALAPLDRLNQSRATIQQVGISIGALPFLSCFGNSPVQAQSHPVFIQPTPQSRPAADQGFVS